MNNKCLCGCGEETKLDSSKYLPGHFYRILSKKELQEFKRKQSDSIKEFYKENKHHNDKRIELICFGFVTYSLEINNSKRFKY